MITLGYWAVRGRGQVLRFLLDYTKANWQETTYVEDPKWFDEDKYKLGLHFPNIPYLIDGDVRLTQTQAIARYIIERSGQLDLLGKDVKDRAMVNNIIGVHSDCNDLIANILYLKDGLSLRDENWKKIEPKLTNMLKVKGSKKWLLPYLTWGDFVLNQFSYHIEKIYPNQYQKYEPLHQTRLDFNNLPQIKAYFEKENTFKGSFTSKQWANLYY